MKKRKISGPSLPFGSVHPFPSVSLQNAAVKRERSPSRPRLHAPWGSRFPSTRVTANGMAWHHKKAMTSRWGSGSWYLTERACCSVASALVSAAGDQKAIKPFSTQNYFLLNCEPINWHDSSSSLVDILPVKCEYLPFKDIFYFNFSSQTLNCSFCFFLN